MTKTEAVDALLDVGWASGHKYESIPWDMCRTLCTELDDDEGTGPGLLALFLGVANWGVKGWIASWDPAGKDWLGCPPKSGKHLLDGSKHYPYGGLGIPHLDSSSLSRVYDRWPLPKNVDWHNVELDDFNAILRSPYRRQWLEWSTKVVESRDFQRWSVGYWLKRYWAPAVKGSQNIVYSDGSPSLRGQEVRLAAINARISNSVSGVGRRLRREMLQADRQILEYCDYKLRKRGPRAEARAKRQIGYAERVAVIYEAARG